METSVFLAQLIGPIIAVIAIALLLNGKTYLKMLDEFEKSPAMTYIGGVSAFAIGMAIVLHHNVWVLDWPVIFTIFGWGGIIKGVTLLLFPEKVYGFAKAINLGGILNVCAVIYLLLGGYLCYVGYFA